MREDVTAMAQAEGTYDEAQIRAEYADLTRELIARGLQVSTICLLYTSDAADEL